MGSASWDTDASRWVWPEGSGCSLVHPSPQAVINAIQAKQIRHVNLIGDSVLRRFYFTLLAMLRLQNRSDFLTTWGVSWYEDLAPLDRHKHKLEETVNDIHITFQWAPGEVYTSTERRPMVLSPLIGPCVLL